MGNEKALKAKDILYIRRWSYWSSSVVIVSPYDLKVILTRKILVLRVNKLENEYNLTQKYLLYALSHQLTFEQAIRSLLIQHYQTLQTDRKNRNTNL